MTPGQPPQLSSRALDAVPAAIWTLGLVSLFMDTSSELVHSLLPVFMTSVLGPPDSTERRDALPRRVESRLDEQRTETSGHRITPRTVSLRPLE